MTKENLVFVDNVAQGKFRCGIKYTALFGRTTYSMPTEAQVKLGRAQLAPLRARLGLEPDLAWRQTRPTNVQTMLTVVPVPKAC